MPDGTPDPAEGIQMVREPVVLSQVQEMAESQFGDMVKAVVDVEQRIMAIVAELVRVGA